MDGVGRVAARLRPRGTPRLGAAEAVSCLWGKRGGAGLMLACQGELFFVGAAFLVVAVILFFWEGRNWQEALRILGETEELYEKSVKTLREVLEARDV